MEGPMIPLTGETPPALIVVAVLLLCLILAWLGGRK